MDWFSYVRIVSCHISYWDMLKAQWAETIGHFLKREVIQNRFTFVSSVLQNAKEQSPLLKETKKSWRLSLRHRDRGTMIWVVKASYSGKLSTLVEVRQPYWEVEERNFVPFPIVLNKNLPGSLAWQIGPYFHYDLCYCETKVPNTRAVIWQTSFS